MFTLHYMTEDGKVGEPCGGPSVILAKTARRAALARAQAEQRTVAVVAGKRCVYVVRADGRVNPPPGAQVAEREDCKAAPGAPPCFCSACRAARREQRA